MEFKSINNTQGLSNMDLCVVKLINNKVWDTTGFVICVFLNNRFYDAYLFEQGGIDEDDDIGEQGVEYLYLGQKYVKTNWN